MKPPVFEYHDPATVDEAVALLAKLENAKLLAGGQSLMPMLNMRFVFPDHLIDLNRVEGLSGIEETSGRIVIGAMTRQRDLEGSAIVVGRLPVMAEALHHVGHLQTRNRGTIGGSLSHLDPAAELVCMATVYDALVVVAGAAGERTIGISEFPLGYMTPSIGPDEIVVRLIFEPWSAGHGYGFVEYARRHGDFAIVSAAALLEAGVDGTIRRAALALGGVDVAPIRMQEAEAGLIGRLPDEAVFADAAALCGEVDAMSDALVPASYRQHLARVMARRALQTAGQRLGAANVN